MKAKTTVVTGAALALFGFAHAQNCGDSLIGSWAGDLPLDTMPATSMTFSRGDNGDVKAYVLWRWGSPEWCSDVVVEGDTFSFRHPYGQLYRGKVSGDTMTAEIAPCDKSTGRRNGEWAKFAAKRLPEIEPARTADAKFGEPIDLLKDGLGGWETMNPKAKFGWCYKDGVLSNKLGLRPDGRWAGGGANLKTKRADFFDFALSYDVRVPKGSNSGVYLRGRYECQVVDSYGKPVDRHNMAAYYGRVAPSVAAEKEPGEWQHVDVTLYRRHITVVLNGVTIIDNAPVTGVTGGALDSNEFVPGPVYLQGDHSDADFRNMILRPVVDSGVAYTPEKWNLEAREKFAAQRFGIFIHWGLYANYAQGEWYQQQIGIDTETYGRMIDGFCPSKFDAKEWVRVFKDAGAKYVTITSRHHDGFSLWPTKVDDGFNVANTPFRRDILGELAKACEDAGLQLNFYYSLMDWHRKDYPAGSAAKKVFGEQKGDYASYKKFMLGQIGELIDSYHPGNIWFDGEWEHAKHQDDGTWKRTLNWDFDTIYDFIHSKHVLVANNNHQPIRAKEDIQLFERDLPGDNSDAGFSKNQPVANDRPIEQCDVIQKNVWGYKINERNFRTAEDVCAMICRCAAKDSNLLMNIGPDGSGRLPARAVEVMAEVGKWMRANGDAIYGTRGLGLVKNADGSETGKTRKGDVVYTITMPKDANGYPKVEK